MMHFAIATAVLLSLISCASKPVAEPAGVPPLAPVHSDPCPKPGDEPVLAVKTEAGPEIQLCGFEDHEVVSPTGKRAFSEFTVNYVTPTNKTPQKLFVSELAETFWAKPVEGKGLELEEVWFFSEQPRAAIWREITCEAESCKMSDAKCVFQMKNNPFPKALSEFQKKRKNAKDLEEEGEELLDQIWAQALLGDTAAQAFYLTDATGLDENLSEVFASNKKKLADLKNINCH